MNKTSSSTVNINSGIHKRTFVYFKKQKCRVYCQPIIENGREVSAVNKSQNRKEHLKKQMLSMHFNTTDIDAKVRRVYKVCMESRYNAIVSKVE